MTAAELYDKYLTLCAEVDWPPLPQLEWAALFDYLLPDKFLFYANGPFPRSGRNPERDTNTKRAYADKLKIGTLRAGKSSPDPHRVNKCPHGIHIPAGDLVSPYCTACMAPSIGPTKRGRWQGRMWDSIVGGEQFELQSPNKGVRREVGTTSENTARTCKKCLEYLPISRFSKQGKSTRAVCKSCDSARRVRARKEGK
jgi:hypothetical protein